VKDQRPHLYADVKHSCGDKWFRAELWIVCHDQVMSIHRARKDRQAKVSELHLAAEYCRQLIFYDRFEGVDVHKERDCRHHQYERSNNSCRDLPLVFHLSCLLGDAADVRGLARMILPDGALCRYSGSVMLILASASPRRRELLVQSGLKFTVEAANLNEDLLPDEAAAAYVRRLAEEKAQAIWNANQSSDAPDDPLVVLGADTCVVCDGHILGKPVDTADARRMLELLSGRTHAVLTGLAAVTANKIVRDVEVTQVTFNQLNDAEIARYIGSGEPLDKAGAYAIQGYAARWIPRIEGCYFNVVGLPIARTIALLADAQAPAVDAL
jgi:septum formation protein